MKKKPVFSFNINSSCRPQVLLIGNGLERGCAPTIPDPKGVTEQLSWDELVAAISVDGCVQLSKEEKNELPFPLMYSLLSVPNPAPVSLTKNMLEEEENRLKAAMNKLSQSSNWRLDALKSLGADHILTTNYSYGLEQSFFPGKDFLNSKTRSYSRFNLNPENQDGSKVGLWHIHGECSVSRSVVLGHDRYGRLLSRIEKLCDSQNYFAVSKKPENVFIHSWPELFLYGDIYIVGFGFHHSEYDLWWLMKRKQRERMGTGRVYFYEQPNEKSPIQKMMRAHGAELPNVGAALNDYDDFYKKTFDDIAKRIRLNKAQKL